MNLESMETMGFQIDLKIFLSLYFFVDLLQHCFAAEAPEMFCGPQSFM